ncbi:MAG: allantoinase AllB [Thermomicrobiales bacterium]
MPDYDLIVRNGTVVTDWEAIVADIAIADGVFVAIGPGLEGTARQEIVLPVGSVVLPGLIDPHVHFNAPGREAWEGWQTGSAALAAGGATACFDMPLNAHPPTLDAASFDQKRRRAEASSCVDFALWGGLTPGNLDHMSALADRGVVGFKAFMASAGTDDFPRADDLTLLRGMRIAADLDLPVAVHAENETLTRELAAEARRQGGTGWRDVLESRPVVAEIEAIGRAIAFAEETGCRLHIAHVSTGRGVALVASARERGVDVTCETCPHYLVLTDEDAERIGALAKCAPPLRDAATRDDLWSALLAGEVDMVASDHSPASPDMRAGDDAFATWGGISGCQHALPAMLTEGDRHGLPMSRIAALIATNAAQRFRLPQKGRIAVGFDADLSWTMRVDAWNPIPLAGIRYRHPASAWDGVPMGYRVLGTIRRGEVIFRDGAVTREAGGRLLRPGAPRGL